MAERKGWFQLPRGLMNCPEFKPGPCSEYEAFVRIIEWAAYRAHSRWFCGSFVSIERGQFVTSYRKLAESFGWGTKQARGFLTRMVKCRKLELGTAQLGTHAYTVITVCDYDRFQAGQSAKGTRADHSGTRSGPVASTQKKEEKNNANKVDLGSLEAAAVRLDDDHEGQCFTVREPVTAAEIEQIKAEVAAEFQDRSVTLTSSGHASAPIHRRTAVIVRSSSRRRRAFKLTGGRKQKMLEQAE